MAWENWFLDITCPFPFSTSNPTALRGAWCTHVQVLSTYSFKKLPLGLRWHTLAVQSIISRADLGRGPMPCQQAGLGMFGQAGSIVPREWSRRDMWTPLGHVNSLFYRNWAELQLGVQGKTSLYLDLRTALKWVRDLETCFRGSFRSDFTSSIRDSIHLA